MPQANEWHLEQSTSNCGRKECTIEMCAFEPFEISNEREKVLSGRDQSGWKADFEIEESDGE